MSMVKTTKSTKDKGGKAPHLVNGVKDKNQPTAEQMRIAWMADSDKHGTYSEMVEKIKEVSDLTGRSVDDACTALHDCNGDANQAVDLLFEKDNCQNEWHEMKKKKKPVNSQAPIPRSEEQEVRSKPVENWEQQSAPLAAGDAHAPSNRGKRDRGKFAGRGRGFVNGASNSRERNSFGFESNRGRRKGGSNTRRPGGNRNFRDRECNFKSSPQNSQSQPPTQHIDVWSNNTPSQKHHDDSFHDDADDWDGTLEESLVLTRSTTVVQTQVDAYAPQATKSPQYEVSNHPPHHTTPYEPASINSHDGSKDYTEHLASSHYPSHYNKEASECIKNAIGVNSTPSQQYDKGKMQPILRAKVPPPSKIPQSAVEMPGMTPNLRLDVQFGTWDYSHSDAVVTTAEHVEKSQPITFQQVLAQSHTESASPAFQQQQAVANEHLNNKPAQQPLNVLSDSTTSVSSYPSFLTTSTSQLPPYNHYNLARTSSSYNNHPANKPPFASVNDKSASNVFSNSPLYHQLEHNPPLTKASYQPSISSPPQSSSSSTFHHQNNYKVTMAHTASSNTYSSEMIFHNQTAPDVFRSTQFRSDLDGDTVNKLVSGFHKANLKDLPTTTTATLFDTQNTTLSSSLPSSSSPSISSSLINKSSSQLPTKPSVQHSAAATTVANKSLSSYLGVGGNNVNILNHNYMHSQPPGFQIAPFGYHQGNMSQYQYEDLPVQHQRFNQQQGGPYFDMSGFQNLNSNTVQRNEQQQQHIPSANQAFSASDGKLGGGSSGGSSLEVSSAAIASSNSNLQASAGQHFPAAFTGYPSFYYNQNVMSYYPMALPMPANQSSAPTSQFQKQPYPFNMGAQSQDFKSFTSPSSSHTVKAASSANQGGGAQGGGQMYSPATYMHPHHHHLMHNNMELPLAGRSGGKLPGNKTYNAAYWAGNN